MFPCHTAEVGCAGESCSAHSKSQEMTMEKEPSKIGESFTWLDIDDARDKWTMDKWKDVQLNGGTNERVTEDGKGLQLLEGMDDSSIHNQKGLKSDLKTINCNIIEGAIFDLLHSLFVNHKLKTWSHCVMAKILLTLFYITTINKH